MENTSWLIRAILISGILTIGIIIVALLNMKRAFEAKKENNKIKRRYSLIPMGCLLIAVLSWVLNFGFLRLKLTVQSVPFIHAFFMLAINLYAVKKTDNSKVLRRVLIAMYVSYVSAYLFMPDVAEGGSVYVLFGLIKDNETVVKLCNSIYPALFAANIVFMVGAVIAAVSAKEKFTLPEKKKSDYVGGKKTK